MELLTPILQAIGLFVATNIDDIIVLSLFYARGAGQRGTTRKILLGQYLGFGGILLALGLYAAWRAWRNRGDDDDDEAKVADKQVGVLTVAAVTFANGGDNIGVYVPVFATASTTAIIAYCLVFLALVGLLVLAAKYVATRRPIAEILERWEHILFPLVLIGLGIVILLEGGAFGL